MFRLCQEISNAQFVANFFRAKLHFLNILMYGLLVRYAKKRFFTKIKDNICSRFMETLQLWSTNVFLVRKPFRAKMNTSITDLRCTKPKVVNIFANFVALNLLNECI